MQLTQARARVHTAWHTRSAHMQNARKHAHSPNNLRSSSSRKDPFVLLAGREEVPREGAGEDIGRGVGAGVSNWMSKRESAEAESNRERDQPCGVS